MLIRVYSGSSPRVRGTVNQVGQFHLCARFIPACAGNSAAALDGFAVGPVHPRVCGEQGPIEVTVSPGTGSSPRVRGTVAKVNSWQSMARFIPACAGNSPHGRTPQPQPAVHPRVCGEQSNAGANSIDLNGSSPRVRGTGPLPRNACRVDRFIPACAGNSAV